MTFGDVPEGFSGLLERIGERPLDRPGDYLTIYQMLARNDVRAADALRGAGRITRRKLEVLSSLDARWHHANTLERLDTGAEAITFNAAVDFVQAVSSRATDETVAEAIARMRPTSTLPRLLDRFIRRADRLPPNPIQIGDNELRPLATGRDLLEAGHRYRNCLAHRLSEVAAGKLAVGEFRTELLVEFRPLSLGAGWMLRDVHGPRNGPVPLVLLAEVEAKCDALGILRINNSGGAERWKSYRRFTGELEWG